jgi:hypothetical protein
VTAVVFDVGETLVDETRAWKEAGAHGNVPEFTLMGVVGGLAARGQHHGRAWAILGVEPPESAWTEHDFYADARRRSPTSAIASTTMSSPHSQPG